MLHHHLKTILVIIMIGSSDGDSSVSVAQNTMTVLVKGLQDELKTCMQENLNLMRKLMTCGPGVPKKDIAFHVGLKKPIKNLPSNYKVVFDKVFLNEGNAYDPHNGVFTCPANGIYAFDWTILTQAGKYFFTDFMVNGVVVGRSHPNGVKTNRAASSMVVQKLEKGDKVWIEPHAHYVGQYAYADFSFYSGFKI